MAGEKLQESVIAGHFECWFCINAIRFWCLWVTGADPGFFSGGGAPLRNDVTDSELKDF